MADDLPATKAFYAAVLGWSYEDSPEEFGGYVLCTVEGEPAAGLGPSRPGARTDWTLYLATDDADATATAIAAAGGEMVVAPGDVGELGRMALATDPTGGFFGIWQAGTHIGGYVNAPGGLLWEDLRSTDPDAARAFYGSVFGYSYDAVPGAGDDYWTFAPGDEPPFGGMGGVFGEDDTGSHWLVYFAVADIEAAVSAVAGAGGSVVTAPFDTPYGKMAGLVDPGGAVFWISQNTGQPVPDRG